MLAVFGGMGVPAALIAPTLAARGRHTFLLVLQFAVAFALGELALLLAPAHLTLLWVILAGWGSGAFPLALALIGLRSRTPAGAGALSGFAQGIGYFVAGLRPDRRRRPARRRPAAGRRRSPSSSACSS